MRICVDVRPALHHPTGVGTYVRGLLRALAAAFPTDEYTALSASWRHRLDGSTLPANVRVSDWRLPVRALEWCWHRLRWPAVERLVGPLDVAHSPSPMLLPARRARMVVTVHDCYFLRHPEEVDGVVRHHYVPLARASAQRADAVLCPSTTTAAEVEELMGVPRSRIHVTPLGVDPVYLDDRAPAEARERTLRSLGVRPPYLLFVGRREPRKGLDTLLAAMDELAGAVPELQLAIVGPEAPGWWRIWDGTSPRVRARCRCLPHQPARVLVHLYGGAAAAVIPSRWEGFGLTGLEAMARGAPVVASRAGALPEVLSDAALWVDPADSAALADACRRLVQDAGLAAELRRRGRQRASGFRWERTAALTHALYRRLSG